MTQPFALPLEVKSLFRISLVRAIKEGDWKRVEEQIASGQDIPSELMEDYRSRRYHCLGGDHIEPAIAAAEAVLVDASTKFAAAYTDGRACFGSSYIENCLVEFNEEVREVCTDDRLVLLALLFHKFKWGVIGTEDYEEASAECAKTMLERFCISQDRIEQVVTHIRALKQFVVDRKEVGSRDTAIFLDITRSMYGKPYELFLKHEVLLFAEYKKHDCSREQFAERRILFYRSLFRARDLYFTRQFLRRYEEQARQNIGRYLRSLERAAA